MDYLKLIKQSEIASDETSTAEYIPTKLVTVQQFCDDILSNQYEWGSIGIYNNTVDDFRGKPYIEYRYGQYIDENKKPIDFHFPKFLATSYIKKIKWYGGWSYSCWLIYIIVDK